ncbi:glycosyltransferase family 1 protein [Backusella circina FSU 941]|nr:glycosyltransferase family 1 protein [Backusella circina FSU 941]
MLHYAFLTFDSLGHVAGIVNLADKLLKIHPEIKVTVYVVCSIELKWGTTKIADNPIPGLNVVKFRLQPDGDNNASPFGYSLHNPKALAQDIMTAIQSDLPQQWPTLDLLAEQCNLARLHDGMLINDQEETYHPDYVSVIKNYLGNAWFIGYLPPLDTQASRDEENPLFQWLDLQKPRSVIYIAVGTEASLGVADRVELALALEAVGCPVVWSLKKPKPYRPIHAEDDYKEREPAVSIDEYGLPEGWRERMKSRAMVMEWVPQIRTLSHLSTGLFISHCGWNSLSECISAAGIPILGLPMMTDQPMNADMMEKRLKIGQLLWESPTEGEIERHTAATLIRQVMNNEEFIKNAAHLKERNNERFNVGSGTSMKRLDDFFNKAK